MTKITAFLIVSLFTSTTAFAQINLGKRLIQTSETQTAWMNESEIAALSEKEHQAGKCPGFMDITDYQEILAEIDSNRAALEATLTFPVIEPTQQAVVEPLIKEVSAKNMYGSVEKLSSFFNRYSTSQTGVDSANWVKAQFEAYAGKRDDIIVDTYKHNFLQPSVIAQIEGEGDLANEIVVIGGHMDSISGFGFFNQRAPGADDNASGTATLLEVFRVLAESGFKPARTLQFMAYAGEERGLLGSIDIATQYQKQGTKVFSAMQFDMTMFPGKDRVLTFVVDNVNLELTQFVKKLVDTYLKMPVQDTKCGYACSDHASWTRAGYASVFPFEANVDQMNTNIHTTKDTLDILDVEYGSHFAKIGVAYAVEASLAK